MTTAATSVATSNRHPRRVPGEGGIWVFIFGDMFVFAFFFGVFLYYRALTPETFLLAQQQMSQGVGMFNTALLLTSSWFVALAVQAARKNLGHLTPKLLLSAIACGAAFCVVKYFEYSAKVDAGLTLSTNYFYTMYYMLTGIHLFHVLMGITLLALIVRRSPRNGIYGQTASRDLEVGATFWHLVDVLWIVLFALFYLIQ